VGTHLPLAAGVGYAIKYRGGDQVVLCFFGDSVVNGGPFHEAFNMVAKWELPVVYVVENNSYGMGTDIDRVAAVDDLFTRACAYQGKKAEQVDGMDVLAVYARPRGPRSSRRVRTAIWVTRCPTRRTARIGLGKRCRRSGRTTRSTVSPSGWSRRAC
jgi:TPP-dependent pyruvate/acetoin dehydrogenase alpha subunit